MGTFCIEPMNATPTHERDPTAIVSEIESFRAISRSDGNGGSSGNASNRESYRGSKVRGSGGVRVSPNLTLALALSLTLTLTLTLTLNLTS